MNLQLEIVYVTDLISEEEFFDFCEEYDIVVYGDGAYAVTRLGLIHGSGVICISGNCNPEYSIIRNKIKLSIKYMEAVLKGK